MKNNNVGALVATSGLVVGNLIGAGILALPISLGIAGLAPSATYLARIMIRVA